MEALSPVAPLRGISPSGLSDVPGRNLRRDCDGTRATLGLFGVRRLDAALDFERLLPSKAVSSRRTPRLTKKLCPVAAIGPEVERLSKPISAGRKKFRWDKRNFNICTHCLPVYS